MIGLVIFSVAILGLVYWLYMPFDAQFKEPWKLRITAKTMEIFFLTARSFEFFGIDTFVNTIRKILEVMFKSNVKKDPRLQISEEEMDGVLVRVYVPKTETTETFPAIVYFHGGGWILGSRNTVDFICRKLAISLNAVVVNVEYRMAPEVTFPGPLDDCVAVTKHFMRRADKYNVDPNRIAVAGDSAGGNLAAAVSLRLRDEKISPPVKLQVLVYPVLQGLHFQTPSYQQNARGPMLPRSMMANFWSMYLAGDDSLEKALLEGRHLPLNLNDTPQLKYLENLKLPKEFLKRPYTELAESFTYDKKIYEKIKHQLMDPYLAPLVADDLSNLPEAYVMTCHLDVLRDEGCWFAERLKDEGNKVTYKHYRNGFHGLLSAFDGPMKLVEGEMAMQDLIDYLKEAL